MVTMGYNIAYWRFVHRCQIGNYDTSSHLLGVRIIIRADHLQIRAAISEVFVEVSMECPLS